jgi:RNA polymerase sigma factor (TIGR02999 family)
MSDVTRILSQINDGDPQAAEQLLPLVYDELRKLAAVKMAQEKPGQTLQATALVHEAYVRLVDVERAQHWNSRAHFFAAAVEAIRRILVEGARRKQAKKRGGGLVRVDLGEVGPAAIIPSRDDLLALHEALTKLEQIDTRKADVVKLRFFAGLTVPQVAELLGISASTVDNYWAYARAWLRAEMAATAEMPDDGKNSGNTIDSLG